MPGQIMDLVKDQVPTISPDGGGWMKKILVHLADDHPLGTSVARLSLIGQTSDLGNGRRREGRHHGGFSLGFLPVWKSREVYSASRTISISVLGVKYVSLSHGSARPFRMSSRRFHHEPSWTMRARGIYMYRMGELLLSRGAYRKKNDKVFGPRSPKSLYFPCYMLAT